MVTDHMRRFAQSISTLLLVSFALFMGAARTHAAALVVTPTNSTATVDLSAEGSLDWAHWGLDQTNSFNRKQTVAARISNFTLLGTNSTQSLTNSPATLFTWTNGMPVAATNTTNQIAVT